MELLDRSVLVEHKLAILSDAAKYDVACTSSGIDRKGKSGALGNTAAGGICHSFSADGRCISLLKILLTNECVFDCKYCMNRRSNDVPRATFTPKEICELTMEFYRRNYIEGLFLSSGIIKSPNYTSELLYAVLYSLRYEHNFRGYIHVKAIPGTDKELIESIGYLADRMSVNLELPTAEGLKQLAPNKTRTKILTPMRNIQNRIIENKNEIVIYKNTPKFVPAGQSTQMIIGATPESDFQLVTVAEALYNNYKLKRVFYSAFISSYADSRLPILPEGPPLLREHRLYQADWLMRYYNFTASELLSEDRPNFNVLLDPKCDWAIRNLEQFPIEINCADYKMLLRVPGIGIKSAKRIVLARCHARLDFADLKRMGVVLKRAQYFITCNGKLMNPIKIDENYITEHMIGEERKAVFGIEGKNTYKQLSLFDNVNFHMPLTAENYLIGV
jgi:putative DNA modification/repair radical SAM protein